MPSCRLRPHHGLCVRFFENKGYSDGFKENMAEVIRQLNENDPEIIISEGADCICSACPELSSGRCTASGKAWKYDSRVTEICGLSYEQRIRWSSFQKIIEERIIISGKLYDVCGDCRWYHICRR